MENLEISKHKNKKSSPNCNSPISLNYENNLEIKINSIALFSEERNKINIHKKKNKSMSALLKRKMEQEEERIINNKNIKKKNSLKDFNNISNFLVENNKKLSVFANFKNNCFFSPKKIHASPIRRMHRSKNLKLKKFITIENANFIKNALKNNFLFQQLQDIQLEQILEKIYIKNLIPGNQVKYASEIDDNFYIIEKGLIEVKYPQSKKALLLKEGESFGDLTLLESGQSNYDAIAIKETTLFCLSQIDYVELIKELHEKKYIKNREIVDSIKLFDTLTEGQKNNIALNLQMENYEKGKVILKEGFQSDAFYIISQGKILVLRNGEFFHYLEKGNCFGENILINSLKSYSAVVASNICEIFFIKQETFLRILGGSVNDLALRNMVLKAFNGSDLFSQLNNCQIDKIMKKMEILCYGKDIIIIEKDESNEENYDKKIYVLVDGTLHSIFTNQEFEVGKIFGLEFLIDESFSFKEPIKAKTDCVIAEFPIKFFEKIFGMKFKQLIKKNKKSYNNNNFDLINIDNNNIKKVNINNDLKNNAFNLEEEDTKIQENNQLNYKENVISANNEEFKIDSLAEIEVISEIGDGFTGIVYLCKYKGDFYALKTVEKFWVIKNGQENYIRNEKQNHKIIDFPYIPKLYASFKTENFVFFLQEFIDGADFSEFLMLKNFPLTSEQIVYFTATIVLCLEYLHQHGIIHRDLKPENMIITRKGYVNLIDLGASKQMLSKNARTYTRIGTYCYNSPEMILGKGYSFSTDLWSLGICLFEFFFNYLPFGVEKGIETYEAIVLNSVIFPSNFNNKHAKSLIKQLLKKEPEARMKGSSISLIKNHKFFEGVKFLIFIYFK